MTLKEKMDAYGITEEDMNADVSTLSDSVLKYRFAIEFDSPMNCFGYFQTGDYGYSDGKNFRLRPDNETDEDETKLIKESLKQKKNLFIERWTNIAHYRNDVEY